MDYSFVFAVPFACGVAAGVYLLVRGVEQDDHTHGSLDVDRFGREVGSGRISLTIVTIAACLVLFGFFGYVSLRAGVGATASTIVAIAVTAVLGPLATRLVRRWAVLAATTDAPDPRYALQGHVGRVVRGSSTEAPAQVQYTANGKDVVAVARSIDGSPLLLNAEVVIDRVEDDELFVEPWSLVEQRL